MPVMDGYQTLETIRAKHIDTNVVVISGDIQPEAHARVKALGAIDFIQKPVDTAMLQSVLHKHQVLQKTEVVDTNLPYAIRDCYQEITNIAMGQAGRRGSPCADHECVCQTSHTQCQSNRSVRVAYDAQ